MVKDRVRVRITIMVKDIVRVRENRRVGVRVTSYHELCVYHDLCS